MLFLENFIKVMSVCCAFMHVCVCVCVCVYSPLSSVFMLVRFQESTFICSVGCVKNKKVYACFGAPV